MEDGWLLGDESLVNSAGSILCNSLVPLRDLCGSGVEFFTTEVTEDRRESTLGGSAEAEPSRLRSA